MSYKIGTCWYEELTEFIQKSLEDKAEPKKPETLKEYVLSVCCTKEGMVRDAGEHSRGNYSDDETAIKELSKEVVYIRQNYDEVSYQILYNARIVKQGRV